ncbi:MAG: type II toxin-antitoxin system RatA family toxin [Alphaproteobacteria bacterium]|nr:type II toxin-antitoxin system RatA family toxin [Alphaproteobacteria bacterium]
MPTHHERRQVAFTPEQLFDMVADIERYPEFLPWCVGARIDSRQGDVVVADLMIGFKLVRETFTSRIVLERPDKIHVTYVNGPLRNLRNHWVFEPAPGGAVIDFFVDFEFHSRILRALIGVVFHEAIRRMVGAFEARARVLYGAGGAPLAANSLGRREV